MAPINISSLELIEVRAVDDEKVGWTGGSSPTGARSLPAPPPSTSPSSRASGSGVTQIPSRRPSSSTRGAGNCASTRALARWRPAM